MELLKKIYKAILSGIGIQQKDELVGLWATEDAGGFHMVMGQALEFKNDGTGILYYWGSYPEPYNDEIPVLWERINRNTIKIKEADPDVNWQIVDYEMKPYIGGYSIHYRRLTSPGFKAIGSIKEGFWQVYDALVMLDK